MEDERDAKLVDELRALFAAASRLRDGARRHPEASRGLMQSARLRVAKAATLAGEICSGARSDRPAPAAVNAT